MKTDITVDQAIEEVRVDPIRVAQFIDPLAGGWYEAEHLRQIADVLVRVEKGELKRVIIAVPPRHWKSSLSSEKFPAWWLGRHPESSVIVASYAVSLAEKFSKSVREIIGSNERYGLLFPKTRLKKDSNSADDWLLEGGYRTSFRAVGTGGGISGHGAKLVILDDVSDPNKVLSETATQADWTWYKNVIRTRLEPDGAIVIVNNRVGANDLTGYLLDPERNDSADPVEDWTYVEIPAQKPDGSFLWEERFGKEYYQKLELDPYLWRVQYLQKVIEAEGNEIKREWFEFAELPEGALEQCRVVDTAWTLKKTNKSDPDYTASIGSVMKDGWLYLVDPFKFRQELPEVVKWIAARKKQHPRVRFGMAKASGELISRQFLSRQGIPIESLAAESVDIRVRLAAFISFASQGKIKLVGDKGRWEQFLTEATSFPGKHDDLLACCAGLTQMHGLVLEWQKREPLQLFRKHRSAYGG
jgi:phage terminase large subunit-like protein